MQEPQRLWVAQLHTSPEQEAEDKPVAQPHGVVGVVGRAAEAKPSYTSGGGRAPVSLPQQPGDGLGEGGTSCRLIGPKQGALETPGSSQHLATNPWSGNDPSDLHPQPTTAPPDSSSPKLGWSVENYGRLDSSGR